MMNKYIFIILLLLSGISVAFGNFEENKVLIRIKTDSNELKYLKENKGIKEIDALTKNSKIYRFVSDELLKPNSNYKYNENDFQYFNPTLDKLSRTYVLEYKDNFNPLIFSENLKSLNFIELAEAIPINKFTYTPNDSLWQKQYYLSITNALKAYDLVDSDDSIIVGIVDTGIDLLHEDLKDNLFINYGEIGIDNNGNDKSKNKIDDDNNGFIDDFCGWDFLHFNSDSLGDSDPSPGNPHGTHVGGTVGAISNNIIGIAGVGKNVKLIPVKISPDQSWSTNTVNAYQGILYAAKMGAKIINCSWGSPSISESERLILDLVSQYNCLVVCAAGNESSSAIFYPGAYPSHLCVSALSMSNRPAGFTNYGESVGISAPGVDIFATIPNNEYSNMSGTSMASPIVAGCAALLALKHPEYTPDEIKRHLQAAANKSIYDLSPAFKGYLGEGIVDVLKAVQETDPVYIYVDKYNIFCTDTFNVKKGDSLNIDLEVKNYFNELENVNITIVPIDSLSIRALSNDSTNFLIDKIASKESISLKKVFYSEFIDDIPLDFELKFLITITHKDSVISYKIASIRLNQSYINHHASKIATTINSKGNIGFSDFPTNKQGIGFYYGDSDNQLFEGAIILGRKFGDSVSLFNLWDMARTENGVHSDDFIIQERAKRFEFQNYSLITSKYRTKDVNLVKNLKTASLEEVLNSSDDYTISQNVYFYKTPEDLDYIISEYNIKNNDTRDYDSLYLGLFFDWDNDLNTHSSNGNYNLEYDFSYIGAASPNVGAIYTGSKLISSLGINYYPILNSSNSFGIHDGFTDLEKIQSISGGIQKYQAEDIGDISEVIGAGPFSLKAGEETKIAFAVMVNHDPAKFVEIAENAKNYLDKISLVEGTQFAKKLITYPNPTKKREINIKLSLENDAIFDFSIYDNLGRFIKGIYDDKLLTSGINEFQIDLGNLNVGNYYLLVQNKYNYYIEKITILE